MAAFPSNTRSRAHSSSRAPSANQSSLRSSLLNEVLEQLTHFRVSVMRHLPPDTQQQFASSHTSAVAGVRELDDKHSFGMFGTSGSGKSTILNSLLGIRLLPTKDDVQGIAPLQSTTALTIEIVKQPDVAPGFFVQWELIDHLGWRQMLSVDLDSDQPESSFIPLLPDLFRKENICSKKLLEAIEPDFPKLEYPNWHPIPEFPQDQVGQVQWFTECYTQQGKFIEPESDSIYTFLKEESNRHFHHHFHTREDASLFLLALAGGFSPLCPLVTKLRIISNFPEAVNMPYYLPFYDIPGSGDALEARRIQRMKAMERIQWGMCLIQDRISEELVSELTSLHGRGILQNLLFVQTQHFATTDAMRALLGLGSIRELVQHRLARNQPEQVLESWRGDLKTQLEEFLRKITTDPDWSIPIEKIAVTDRTPIVDDFANVGGQFQLARTRFCAEQETKIWDFIAEISSGKSNKFDGVARTIAAALNISLRVGEIDIAFESEANLPEILPWDSAFTELQDNMTPLDNPEKFRAKMARVVVRLLHDQYQEWLQHKPSYHLRIKRWAAGSGRLSMANEEWDTLEAAALKLFGQLKLGPHLTRLRKAVGKQDRRTEQALAGAFQSFETTCVTRLHSLIRRCVRSAFVPPLNKYSPFPRKEERRRAKRRGKSPTPYLDNLEEIVKSDLLAIPEESIQRTFEKPLSSLSDALSTILAPFVSVSTIHPVGIFPRDLAGCLRSGFAAMNLYCQFQPRLTPHLQIEGGLNFLHVSSHPRFASSTLYSNSEFLNALEEHLPRGNATRGVLSLRMLNLVPEVLEELIVLLKGRNLNIDLCGNPELSHESLVKFASALQPSEVVSAIFTSGTMNRADIQLSCEPSILSVWQDRRVCITIGNSMTSQKNQHALEGASATALATEKFLLEKKFESIYNGQIASAKSFELLITQLRDLANEPTPVALVLSYAGHGGRADGVQLIEATNGELLSFAPVYSALSHLPKGSVCWMIFDCCSDYVDPRRVIGQSGGVTLPERILQLNAAGPNRPGYGTLSPSEVFPFTASLLAALRGTATMSLVSACISAASSFKNRLQHHPSAISNHGFPDTLHLWE